MPRGGAPREEVRLTRPFVTTDNTNLSTSDIMPLAESDGSLKISLQSKDAAGNLESPLVDTNDALWVREFKGYVPIAGVAVSDSEGAVLDGSASLTSGAWYEVEFLVVNIDGSNSVAVTVGRDIGAAGGAIGAAEYWMVSEVVPAPGTSGWRGPFLLQGQDDVRAVAAAASDAIIQWRVKRVDIGA